jgi:hypothetical protein
MTISLAVVLVVRIYFLSLDDYVKLVEYFWRFALFNSVICTWLESGFAKSKIIAALHRRS